MEVHDVKVKDIKPYERNAKKHPHEQIEQIAKSIEKFGWAQPLAIDKSNTIIIGHGRLEAAKLLGQDTVPCVTIEDLTDEEIRMLRLADNKLNESEWDDDMLKLELDDLDFSDFDLDWGIDLDDENEVEEDDYDPEPPEEPESKLGEIYLLGGRHRLMCGDSTKMADVEKLMDGAKADLFLTDPPYGVDYQGGTKKKLKIENDDKDDDEFLKFLTDAFRAADSVMKPGACFYIWHADSRSFIFRSACRETGWVVRQCLIWEKNQLVVGRQDYQWKHEPCLYGWKEGAGHLWASDRKQTTILNFDRPQKSAEHPTMKPIALFDYQMKNNTKGGDLVLDLFGGSGTSIMAAEQNGRICYMMEYDPKYIDVIIDRYEKFTGEKAVKISG